MTVELTRCRERMVATFAAIALAGHVNPATQT